MKKRLIVLLALGILLISPFILAQEESQTYSGFNRFVDNVRMFFTFGEGKVTVALEIREKEVNSAIENIKTNNTEEANVNLENAFDKLTVIQEQVSPNLAEEVTTSVNQVIEKIEESNLTQKLDRYVLEEKKTQLVAKLVVEVNGTEGQTLTREIVRNETEGRNVVQVNVEGGNNKTATWEIVGEIDGIENNISGWVVGHTYAEGTTAGGEGGVVVEGEGNGTQVYVAEGGHTEDEPLPEPDLNKINPELYDPNARAPGDTVDDTYDDDSINNGNCGDGVVCE